MAVSPDTGTEGKRVAVRLGLTWSQNFSLHLRSLGSGHGCGGRGWWGAVQPGISSLALPAHVPVGKPVLLSSDLSDLCRGNSTGGVSKSEAPWAG